MNRRIALYLDGKPADLSDAGLILMNYTFSDLQSPAAVKNSYSKTVTLPGTPANDAIFGFAGRLDRSISSGTSDGAGFNPLKRIPFVVMDTATGAALEEGYARLDGIKSTGAARQYSISLFGGLGSLFYLLTYGKDGEKLTLAGLQYLDGSDTELDFTINADAVKAAWDTLTGEQDIELWAVLNFIPAYNGLPDGNFDPAAAWYNGRLVKLAKEHTEWEMKDLRSYLQRPAISFAAILAACKRKAEENGFILDYSAVPSSYYARLWKTLPMLSECGPYEAGTGAVNLEFSAQGFDVPGSVPSGILQTTTAAVDIFMNLPTGYTASQNITFGAQSGNYITGQVAFIYLTGTGTDSGVTVGNSKVRALVYSGFRNFTPESLASALGYDFQNLEFEDAPVVMGIQPEDPDNGIMAVTGSTQLTAEGQGATRWEMSISWVTARLNVITGEVVAVSGSDVPRGYLNGTAFEYADWYYADGYGTTKWETTQNIGSGVKISKSRLLKSAYSPAEYLIGFAKMFGLVFSYDPAMKKATIMPRTGFFTGVVEDLSDRVDLSQDLTVTPVLAASQYYDFTAKPEGAEFVTDYEDARGRVYGSQRVDTGCEFETEPVEMLPDFPFKGAAEVNENGKYNNTIMDGGAFVPSVLIDAGNTYEDTGAAVSRPSADADAVYFNEDYNGYDKFSKLQFHDRDEKAVDGADVLVYPAGGWRYPYFRISDDIAGAKVANGGKSPWVMTPADEAGVFVPYFSRYVWTTGNKAAQSLDMGTPQEVRLPGWTVPETASQYYRFWRAFISDRYNANTKVLKCRIRTDGLQPGQELLRRFWWYGGSLWVLNKISNWSLTTDHTAECEFIQVQNKANYTG